MNAPSATRTPVVRFVAAFVAWTVVVLQAALPTDAADDATVTFNKHIAPIVFERCAVCHRPGEVAPFSLLNYRDVKRRARQIVEVTGSRYMPPWKPEPGYGRFVGERRLSDQRISLIERWVEQGIVEGDAADLPRPPTFTSGWQLGQPDHVVTMPEPYTLDPEGTDVYRNFVIPSGTTETRYVRAVEFRPGNPVSCTTVTSVSIRLPSRGVSIVRTPGPGLPVCGAKTRRLRASWLDGIRGDFP